MKRGYILNLYYNALKQQAAKVEKVKGLVKTAAGADWTVLGFGDHICTLGFIADLNAEGFHRDMTGVSDPDFCFLLIRLGDTDTPFAGWNLYGEQPSWFRDRVAALPKQ